MTHGNDNTQKLFSQKASQLTVTTASQRTTHGHLSDVRALWRLGGERSGFKELLTALEGWAYAVVSS